MSIVISNSLFKNNLETNAASSQSASTIRPWIKVLINIVLFYAIAITIFAIIGILYVRIFNPDAFSPMLPLKLPIICENSDNECMQARQKAIIVDQIKIFLVIAIALISSSTIYFLTVRKIKNKWKIAKLLLAFFIWIHLVDFVSALTTVTNTEYFSSSYLNVFNYIHYVGSNFLGFHIKSIIKVFAFITYPYFSTYTVFIFSVIYWVIVSLAFIFFNRRNYEYINTK